MSDAFDQWVEWRYKPPGDRRSIPAELYAAVTSLPESRSLGPAKGERGGSPP
ncbi:hypothetical protein ACVWW2_008497 [Bradyrhizobium sp. LM4.3]